jgi:phage terminase large subunit-like protein
MNNQLLTPDLLEILRELKRRQENIKFQTLFENKDSYPKHHVFFESGKKYKQRMLLGANRIGKTYGGLCEVVMHLTGNYPSWWQGYRFTKPNHWWIVSVDSKLTLSTVQPMLLGNVGEFGSGLIPEDCLDFHTLKDARKAGTGVGVFRVKHITGGHSSVEFKSASSGRAAFQGTEKSIFIDEECDSTVYQECLLRTMTGDNILMMTFTPLMGLTPLILDYYGGEWKSGDGESGPNKYYVNATWEDAKHLTQQMKDALYASLPPHQREARTKGIPSLGSGVIYPVPESTFVVSPFEIPKHWKKAFGLDVGWRRTAALWAAINPEDNTIYLYSEHYVGESEPSTHAAAIRSRGAWIPGVIDSAANGRSQIDGDNLMTMYKDLGLTLTNADKAIETGLYTVWELLSQGRLKIFSNLLNTLSEIRLYRRDEKGKIVKENDHLMDAMRYLMMGRDIACTELAIQPTIVPQVSYQYRPQRKF